MNAVGTHRTDRRLVGALWDLRAALLAAASAGLLVLAFPTPDMGGLAFVALVPLLLAIRGEVPARAFCWGTLTGLLFYLWSISWVTRTMTTYGGLSVSVSALVLLALAAYLALYVGLFCYGTSFIAGAGWPI